MDQQSQRSSQKLDVSQASSSLMQASNDFDHLLDVEFHIGVFTSLRWYSDCHYSSHLWECLFEIRRSFKACEQGERFGGKRTRKSNNAMAWWIFSVELYRLWTHVNIQSYSQAHATREVVGETHRKLARLYSWPGTSIIDDVLAAIEQWQSSR